MEEVSKTPTWQWVSLTAVSMILGIVGYGAVETRMDIKETRNQGILLTARVAVIERANELQYQNTNDRQREIKEMLMVQERSIKQLSETLMQHEKYSRGAVSK